jgi:hypothetical protein
VTVNKYAVAALPATIARPEKREETALSREEIKMEDQSASSNKSSVDGSFKISYLKEGDHIAILPIPNDLLRLIGLVVAHWGLFETLLDTLIDGFITAIKKDIPGWRRLGFTKRKELFKTLVDEWFESRPAIAASYRQIIGDAASLFWQRNIVSHGQYRVTFPPAGSEPPVFWAEGVHNGKPVNLSIDEPTLEQLWHGIAHLTGALKHTVTLHGSLGEWPWTWPDTELLRVYRETIHPWNPNPDKRPPQP